MVGSDSAKAKKGYSDKFTVGHYWNKLQFFFIMFSVENIFFLCFWSHFFSFVCPFCLSVTALLRKLKQQSRETVEDKRPKLLKALKEVNSPHS